MERASRRLTRNSICSARGTRCSPFTIALLENFLGRAGVTAQVLFKDGGSCLLCRNCTSGLEPTTPTSFSFEYPSAVQKDMILSMDFFSHIRQQIIRCNSRTVHGARASSLSQCVIIFSSILHPMCQVSSSFLPPSPPSYYTDKVQTRLAIWEVYIRSSCSPPPLRRKCSVFYPEKVWQAGVFNNITARHSIFSRVPFTLLSNRKSVAIFSTHDIPYTSSSIP